jgi:hypothetical protein
MSDETTSLPPKLRKGDKANFHTLLRATDNEDLALVSAIRKADRAAVALVCAMQQDKDGTITPVPLATMVEGNPYELFEDPTVLRAEDQQQSHTREQKEDL